MVSTGEQGRMAYSAYMRRQCTHVCIAYGAGIACMCGQCVGMWGHWFVPMDGFVILGSYEK